MAMIFVIALIFYIFFRQEVTHFVKNFENQHPYLLIVLLLSAVSYLAGNNQSNIHSFVYFINFNVIKLQNHIAALMYHLFPKWQTIIVFNGLVHGITFAFFLYFPEKYQKKYPSSIYQSQVFAVRVVCYLMLLIMVLIFAANYPIVS